MQPWIVDRTTFIALANRTEIGVRTHQRLVAFAVAHILRRRQTSSPVAWTRLRSVGYYLDDARVHLRVHSRHGDDCCQAANGKCQTCYNSKIQFHTGALHIKGAVNNFTDRLMMKKMM